LASGRLSEAMALIAQRDPSSLADLMVKNNLKIF
jgi:hypothetical protein